MRKAIMERLAIIDDEKTQRSSELDATLPDVVGLVSVPPRYADHQ